MTPQANARRQPGAHNGNVGRGKGAPCHGRCQHEAPDVFAEARATLTVPDAWVALGLPGEPRRSCRSPFRDERNPSFSIFDGDRAWKDHATGAGGDVIEFVRVALGGDHRDAREWLAERLGLDILDGRGVISRPTVPASPSQPPRAIQYPSPLLTLAEPEWRDFARLRALPYPAVWMAVQAGVLRFIKVDGQRCFVVRDEEDRAAEIRRADGEVFANDAKAFPLRGVDKTWLPGLALLRLEPPETRVLLCEGPSDLLAGLGLYATYRQGGGTALWVPVAVLGAGCRRLHPEAADLIAGRRVRLVFDGDEAGRAGAEAWGDLLAALGCDVEAVLMPDGRDLRDMAEAGEIEPGDLFA